MRITDVKAIGLRYELPRVRVSARDEYTSREILLVKVETDDSGIVGWGEVSTGGCPVAVMAAVLTKVLAPRLVGQDPGRLEFLWNKIYQETYYYGRGGLVLAALSGIDIALWDILGKRAAQPVWRLLGGFGKPVFSYSVGGYYGQGDRLESLAAEATEVRAAGYRGFKMQVGNIPPAILSSVRTSARSRCTFEEDLKRVRVAREAVGADRNLMIDASNSLSARFAQRYSEALEALNIRWFEEPVQIEDFDGCVKLAQSSRIAVAGFEGETGASTFSRRMDDGGVQVVKFDIGRVGGISEAHKIASYALAKHLPIACGSAGTVVSSAASLHLLFGIPNGDYFECDHTLSSRPADVLFRPAILYEAGYSAPLEAPGLGVVINEADLQPWIV